MYRHALVADEAGTTLAMASTTGGLWASEDAGASWQRLSRDLPSVAVLRLAWPQGQAAFAGDSVAAVL